MSLASLSILCLQLQLPQNMFPLTRFLISKIAKSHVQRDLANRWGGMLYHRRSTFGQKLLYRLRAGALSWMQDPRIVFLKFRPLSGYSFSECCQDLQIVMLINSLCLSRYYTNHVEKYDRRDFRSLTSSRPSRNVCATQKHVICQRTETFVCRFSEFH